MNKCIQATLLGSLLTCLLCSGCSTSYVKETRSSGDKFVGFNSRFIWASEGVDMERSTNGSKIKIAKTNPDAVTAGAITEAAVKAAISSAKP